MKCNFLLIFDFNSLIMKKVPSFPRFSGSFRTITVLKSEDRENGTQDVFVVLSSGKRQTLLRFLWLKLVWDELSKEEYSLFISFKEVLEDDKIVGFLRARLSVPKKILRKRLNETEKSLGEKISTREEYQGLRRIKYEIHEVTRKLPKVRKYSGYIRTPSSASNKNSRRSSKNFDVFQVEWIEENVIDYHYLFTVGGIEFFPEE